MENIIKLLFDDLVFGFFRKLKIESSIEEVIPMIRSFGDTTSEIIKNYDFQNEKYLKIIVANENWRNNVIALSILINEKNHNLRIFMYISESESVELMYSDLNSLVGLPKETTMNLENFSVIYSRMRQNFL